MAESAQTLPALPRSPVFGWASVCAPPAAAALPHLLRWPHQRLATSGRAALWLALRALQLPAGATVLLPSFHCETMVAPVLALGLLPAWFAIDERGLPQVDRLPDEGAAAIVVAHYFGRAQSLAAVRQWCDARRVALIEDCAHCLHGIAGERPVGGWGDFAIASLTKFLPVPEAGLLVSAQRPLPPLLLTPAPLRRQLQALVDLLERRPARGWDGALVGLWRRLRRRPATAVTRFAAAASEADAATLMAAADLARVGERPSAIAAALVRSLPLGGAMARRRANFQRLAQGLAGVPGTRLLWDPRAAAAERAVPFVLPLWAEEPDGLYLAMRNAGLAVSRWNRRWPGTPSVPGDAGPGWSHHVLQLLCHQSLQASDIDRTIAFIAAHQRGRPA